MTVHKVRDMDEAVEKANAVAYGLAATVFTRDRRKARELAERLNAGAVCVNSFGAFAGIGALPFGGVGESGFGRIHGPDGLREFARPKSVTRRLLPAPVDLLTFDRTPRDLDRALAMIRFLHGRH